MDDNPVDASAVLFELIKREVVLDEEIDHEGGADPDSEADDIDKREDLVAAEGAEGDEEIVS
jgi:hypothetical protein